MNDVNLVIMSALSLNGYTESSYYAVPKGFAVVTRLEQIETNGTPKPPPARWSVTKVHASSPLAYLRALFTADPGYYRVIVFVVTRVPFGSSGEHVSEGEATHWLQNGSNKLPEATGSNTYDATVTCTALIYEFVAKGSYGAERAELATPSHLDAHSHLVASGVWAVLAQH